MIPTDRFDVPSENWRLNEWISAAGGGSNRYLADIGISFGYETNTWNKRLSHWNLTHIPDRETAKKIITILRFVAQQNQRDLFSNEHFSGHSRIFLVSNTCRDKFAPLTAEEISEICGAVPLPKYGTPPSIATIWEKVQPSPPEKLFGRKADLDNCLQAIEQNHVIVIDGRPGDGKTSLAWFAAKQALEAGICVEMDWTTDKRSVIDIHGNVIDTGLHLNSFDDILRSMVARFGWNDLLGATGNDLKIGCAEALRSGRYLIVIDNLESVPASESIIRGLQALLEPVKSREPLASRALITTRVAVSENGVASIPIHGIHPDERVAYIRYVESRTARVSSSLSNDQCGILADATQGNPLFMQLAVRRYIISPDTSNFDEIISGLQENNAHVYRAFQNLFGPLLRTLEEDAMWLACVAAVNAYITKGDLHRLWQTAAEKAYEQDTPKQEELDGAFFSALGSLLQYRIIDVIEGGGYAMHPLIRSYLTTGGFC